MYIQVKKKNCYCIMRPLYCILISWKPRTTFKNTIFQEKKRSCHYIVATNIAFAVHMYPSVKNKNKNKKNPPIIK